MLGCTPAEFDDEIEVAAVRIKIATHVYPFENRFFIGR